LLSRVCKPYRIRLLEKTPKNCLRVPMLAALFQDARFIWVQRRAAPNIDSLIAAWLVGSERPTRRPPRYARAGYPIADCLGLADYHNRWWKFALVPGWRELEGTDVSAVAGWQYYQCNLHAAHDLGSLPKGRVFELKHEDFVKRPVDILRQLLDWAEVPPSTVAERFAARLPRVNEVNRAVPVGRYRHPAAVSAALGRFPQIERLEKEMGYAARSFDAAV
jgi:hypothetical protein